MKRGTILIIGGLLVFICGVTVGYAATMYSLFPETPSGIFATVPDPLTSNHESPARSAHLWLQRDMTLSRNQTWKYVLIVCDAKGQKIGGAEFSPEQVGGKYMLQQDGKLQWDDDARGVTASIGYFRYHCQIDRT